MRRLTAIVSVIAAFLVLGTAIQAQQATPAPVTPAVPIVAPAPVTPAVVMPDQTEMTPEAVALSGEDSRLAVCAAPTAPGFAPVFPGPYSALADLLIGSDAFSPTQIAALNCIDDTANYGAVAALWLPADAFAAGGGIVSEAGEANLPDATPLTLRSDGGAEVQNLEGFTVSWETGADSVTLTLCPTVDGQIVTPECITPYADGQPVYFENTGTVELDHFWKPGEYALEATAYDADGLGVEQQMLLFSVRCSQESLFPVSGAMCPEAPASVVSGAYQPFENGVMMWISDTGQILVLTADGRARYYTDTFQEGMPNPEAVAPEGLLTPVRGFGRVWEFLGGAEASGLGWATRLETGISVFRQPAGRYSFTTFYALPDLPDQGFSIAVTQIPGQVDAYWVANSSAAEE